MDGSFGRQQRAPECPQYPAAPAPTSTTACQLQVLQQVNLLYLTQLSLPKQISREQALALSPAHLQIDPQII